MQNTKDECKELCAGEFFVQNVGGMEGDGEWGRNAQVRISDALSKAD